MSDSLITRALVQACKGIEADLRSNERHRVASLLESLSRHERMDPAVATALQTITTALRTNDTRQLLANLLRPASAPTVLPLAKDLVHDATTAALDRISRGLAK
jgi:hypothetical protein